MADVIHIAFRRESRRCVLQVTTSCNQIRCKSFFLSIPVWSGTYFRQSNKAFFSYCFADATLAANRTK